MLDLVICHGDFLNIDHDYVHKNKSVRGFGSYGDILIRDRKMYVAPTPFGLADGLAHATTLILPVGQPRPHSLEICGELVRRETETLIVGYHFDLRRNNLETVTVPNPAAGREHRFTAYRAKSADAQPVAMRPTARPESPDASDDE